MAKADDAAVYQLDPSKAIITTTDFFPPMVDDPYSFGQVAAANALSDVFAMGAILYRCLTGELPFSGDTTMATLKEVEKILAGGGARVVR